MHLGSLICNRAHANGGLEKTKSLIALHGGKILWEEKKEDTVSLQQNQEISATEVDLKLLTALSMNARLSASRLAEISGVNEQTAYSRVKVLENKLGVKYLLELDVSKLGYTPYIILIKFEGKMPTTEVPCASIPPVWELGVPLFSAIPFPSGPFPGIPPSAARKNRP